MGSTHQGRRLNVLLSGDAGPYPRPFVAGRVTVEGGGPVWRPRRRRRVRAVPLAGTAPLAPDGRGRASGSLRPDHQIICVRAADGTSLRLAVTGSKVAALQKVLADAPTPSGPPAPARPPALVPWYAYVLLAVCAVLSGVAIWFRATGIPVDATVLENRGGTCKVEWADPATGDRRETQVGCASEADPPGERIRILVGEDGGAHSSFDAVVMPLSFAVLAGAFGAVAIAARVVPPRGLGRPPAGPAAAPAGGPVPRLDEGALTWAAAARVLAARAAAEGWAPPPGTPVVPPAVDPPRRWWKVRELRGTAGEHALIAIPDVVLLVAAVAFGLQSWLTVWTLATGEDRPIYARVVDVDRTRPPWLTYPTRVHFHPEGRQLYATVPVTRELAVDERVAIIYSPRHPGRARLDEPGNGLRRQAAVTGAVAVGAAAFAVVLVGRPILTARRLCRLRAGPARAWRYVRYVEPTGGSGLLLYSRFGDGPPEAVVRLAGHGAEVAGTALPVAGEAQVHGDVVHRGLAVPVIAGRTCWPAGRAHAAPPEAVRALVNGDPAGPSRRT